MKKIFVAAFITLALSQGAAFAADRTLECSLNGTQGHGSAKLMKITGHPELILIDLRLEAKINQRLGQIEPPFPATALLTALLVGSFDGSNLSVSGPAQNDDDGRVHEIIDPGQWNVQGKLLPDGSIQAVFYDQKRVLQRGFGASLNCS